MGATVRPLPRKRVRLVRSTHQPTLTDLETRVAGAIDELQSRAGRFAATHYKAAADAMAGSTFGEVVLFSGNLAFDRTIELVTWTGTATVASVSPTPAPPNAATIKIFKRSPGADPVVVAKLSNVGQSWDAYNPVKFDLVVPSLGASETLTIAIEKSGAGVVVPAGLFEVWLVDATQ